MNEETVAFLLAYAVVNVVAICLPQTGVERLRLRITMSALNGKRAYLPRRYSPEPTQEKWRFWAVGSKASQEMIRDQFELVESWELSQLSMCDGFIVLGTPW